MMAMQPLSELTDEQILSAFMPVSTVKEMVSAYGPIPKVLTNCFPDELAKLHGVGPVKARQLQFVCELAKRLYQTSLDLPPVIRTPKDVYERLSFLQHRTVEEFWVILLNTKNGILAERLISIGSINAAVVTPSAIFHRAIKMMANSIILVHNHPSGEVLSSVEDIALTKKLVKAGQLLDVAVLDHVIIGQGQYASLKERGVIE